MGTAYAFFYCRGTQEQIAEKLPTAREMAGFPPALELRLNKGIALNDSEGDRGLSDIAHDICDNPYQYVVVSKRGLPQPPGDPRFHMLQATLPDEANKQAAVELSLLVNTLYQSSLYPNGEHFTGAVVYEQDGHYVFRE